MVHSKCEAFDNKFACKLAPGNYEPGPQCMPFGHLASFVVSDRRIANSEFATRSWLGASRSAIYRLKLSAPRLAIFLRNAVTLSIKQYLKLYTLICYLSVVHDKLRNVA